MTRYFCGDDGSVKEIKDPRISKVIICGIPHEVKYVKDTFDCDTHFGQINYKEAEILLNADSVAEVQKATLCHEMLHGLLVHIGREDLSNDETFVTSLGNAINGSFDVRSVNE